MIFLVINPTGEVNFFVAPSPTTSTYRNPPIKELRAYLLWVKRGDFPYSIRMPPSGWIQVTMKYWALVTRLSDTNTITYKGDYECCPRTTN